jgi:hypothetical protein
MRSHLTFGAEPVHEAVRAASESLFTIPGGDRDETFRFVRRESANTRRRGSVTPKAAAAVLPIPQTSPASSPTTADLDEIGGQRLAPLTILMWVNPSLTG